MVVTRRTILGFPLIFLAFLIAKCSASDILGCGGFVKSHASLDFSKIEIGLYTKSGILKEKTECAPTNGYYFLPLYEKGDYVLKVHPPPGWSFEPSKVILSVDGVTDKCSTGADINFAFNGFGITGKVVTAGRTQGPSGVSVKLVNEAGETRETLTTAGGDFHFTPVIPGKYTVKASHPRWKLEPSQALVQVKEGNTALPVGALAVRGYDVRGSVFANGNPITGLHVLLYSKEDSPKFRVEGCQTALLQGVPDAPICYSVTDATGEFSFDLVPAGEYSLLALAKTPGQAVVTFNVKPESVKFSVGHDSQFLANAFEVGGVTVTGVAVAAAGGAAVAGAAVSLDGRPAGLTDSSGRYTLPALQPGLYTVGFNHEHCEFDDVKLSIAPNGVVALSEARVARWKVCGAVTPADARDVIISADRGGLVRTVRISEDGEGKWCTFLPPGVYTARVEVSDKEKSDGLQFYPLRQQVSVGAGPVAGVRFSQLKATLTGTVNCASPLCRGLKVTLVPQGGAPVSTVVKDGAYTFTDVLPGAVSVQVGGDTLCWRAARHDVTVSSAEARAPAFEHDGFRLRVLSVHNDVEWQTDGASGVVPASPDVSALCVARAAAYTLRSRGCAVTVPRDTTVQVGVGPAPLVEFRAVSHGATVTVQSPRRVDDLTLRVDDTTVGPLEPRAVDHHWEYQHTLQLAEGAVAVVSAHSSSLLFAPHAPQQVVGVGRCGPRALLLRARPALTLAGATVPAVSGARVTVSYEDGETLTTTTGEDGSYRFGPLDAARRYTLRADKESWVFSAPGPDGNIPARRLASLTVRVTDTAGAALQGALVSVSGGAYRRNAATDAAGALTCGSLAPNEYYVKPHLKEYRFEPPHALAQPPEGQDIELAFVGTRVAWSCIGRVVSLGGAGWARADVLAVPLTPSPQCRAEGAPADTSGAFRIRGLVPGCQYRVELKPPAEPEPAALRPQTRPPVLQVNDERDIEGIRLVAHQAQGLTDGAVLVRAHPDHYRTLRISLAAAGGAARHSSKLDSAGYNVHNNPGVVVVLPRLLADNGSYVVTLESTLSKATHVYEEPAIEFVSDGLFKSIEIDFTPKVKGTEQELRASSLLGVPLAAVCALCYVYRGRVLEQLGRLARAAAAAAATAAGPGRAEPRAALDRAAIDHIVSSVAAAGKKTSKKKVH